MCAAGFSLAAFCQLAPAEPGEGGDDHQRVVPGRHPPGEREHLGDGRHRPLGYVIAVIARDAAGVLPDQLVLFDGGVEDHPKE